MGRTHSVLVQRHILFLCLCVMMGLLLTGCVSAGESPETVLIPEEPTNAAPSGEDEPDPVEVSPEPTLDDYLAMTDPELAAAIGVELTEADGAYYAGPAENRDMETILENPFSDPLQPSGFSVNLPAGDGTEAPEQVGLCLAKRYIHWMMNDRTSPMLQTSFLITAYRNLTVEVYDEATVPERFIHREPTLDAGELSRWYVVLSFDYQYLGYVKDYGLSSERPEDAWAHFEGSDYEYCFGFFQMNDMYSFGSDYPAPEATAA